MSQLREQRKGMNEGKASERKGGQGSNERRME